jgi:hypothetical protein
MEAALASSQKLITLAQHPLASSVGLDMAMNFESERGRFGGLALPAEHSRQTIEGQSEVSSFHC